MKKSLLIIMSVAILGGLGLYISKGTSPKTVMADSTSTPASNSVNPISTGQTNTTTDGSTTTPTPASTTTPATPAAPTSQYKDGTYDGSTAGTIYGNVQVAAVISGGKITDIEFLQMPNDQPNSKVVTAMAEPELKSETLKAQNAHISTVSGATQSSGGYKESLQAALDKAAS